jgi:hypothetical protein
MLSEFGWRDDDLKKWDLMQFQVYMLLNIQYFIWSYDWGEFLDVDKATWLYLFVVLATIDTTVVSDLGHGPELYVRILASGLFLTASGGSKTHDTMSHAFSFKQTWVAHRVWRELKKDNSIPDEEKRIIRNSWRAFKLGTPFAHFSDDYIQCCLRRGIPFGQLINRTQFFAEMFGLEFKIAPRPWMSLVGQTEYKLLYKNLLRNSLYKKHVPWLLDPEDTMKEMFGISTSYHYLPYDERVKQWYPLTSEAYVDGEYDADGNPLVGIKNKGVNFLKFYFFPVDYKGYTYIVPIRDHHEMYHKLFFSKVKYKNAAQVLVKLRMYAYYTFKWTKAFNTFKKIHDIIKERHYADLAQVKGDPLLRKEIPRKLDISLEEVMAEFPDQSSVSLFYLPVKKQNYTAITDLRELILSSKYRVLKYPPWELIRRKDLYINIGGCYPWMNLEKREAQILNRTLKSDLVVVGPAPPARTRAKCLPRRQQWENQQKNAALRFG